MCLGTTKLTIKNAMAKLLGKLYNLLQLKPTKKVTLIKIKDSYQYRIIKIETEII